MMYFIHITGMLQSWPQLIKLTTKKHNIYIYMASDYTIRASGLPYGRFNPEFIGQRFISTDRGEVYKSEGINRNAWVKIGVGNALIVDKNSNLGFNEPQEAINEAASGDTVFVYPGIYSRGITLKDGVDIHFHLGADVVLDNPDTYVLSDGGNKVSCKVTGYANFRYVNAVKALSNLTGSIPCYFIGGGVIGLECLDIYTNKAVPKSGANYSIVVSNGTLLYLNVRDILNVSFDNPGNDDCAIGITDAFGGIAGSVIGRARNLLSRGYTVQWWDGAYIDLEAKNVIAVGERGNGFGKTQIDERQIGSARIKAENIFGTINAIGIKDDNTDEVSPDIEIDVKNLYGEQNCLLLETSLSSLVIRGNPLARSLSKNNVLEINNSIDSLVLNGIYYGNISSVVQKAVAEGNLVFDGSDDTDLTVLGGSKSSITLPGYHSVSFDWYWTDGVCIKDSSGNNTGSFRRKVFNSRKFVNGIEVVDASQPPPSENDGDQYVLNYAGSVDPAWDGAPQGGKVTFDLSNDVWNVNETVSKAYADYTRKSFDITEAFSYSNKYGSSVAMDVPSVSDNEFASLSDSDYNERREKFYAYVYLSMIPDDLNRLDFLNIDWIQGSPANLLNIRNESIDPDETPTGDASNATNISCPV